MTRLAVAADVGGTSTRVGLVDDGGSVSSVSVTDTPSGPDAVVGHLVECLGAGIAQVEDCDAGLAGVTVGVPGRVRDDGEWWSTAVNLGIDEPVGLRATLGSRLGVDVVVANDVRLATRGAAHSFPDAHRLAYLSCGTGVAGGCAVRVGELDGRDGIVDVDGEIGHVPVPQLCRPCSCGQVGCAETAAGGRAMLVRWEAAGRPPVRHVGELWRLAPHDPTAADIRRDCLHALAWLVHLDVVGLGVERVVIGGGLSRLGDELLEPLIELLAVPSDSPLVAGYDLAGRVTLAPPDVQYGLIGGGLAAFTRSHGRSS